jgi:hypothetical protein
MASKRTVRVWSVFSLVFILVTSYCNTSCCFWILSIGDWNQMKCEHCTPIHTCSILWKSHLGVCWTKTKFVLDQTEKFTHSNQDILPSSQFIDLSLPKILSICPYPTVTGTNLRIKIKWWGTWIWSIIL